MDHPQGPDPLRGLDVSRETIERLKIYETLLRRWQHIKNLVAPSTLEHVWERHFRDSLQLISLAPGAKRWVDVGAGAGFPGLAIAVALADDPEVSVHLIEADNRKCAFLREVARQTNARAVIKHGRAEIIIPTLGKVDVVMARAVAPLDALVEMVAPLLSAGATGLFLKGRDYKAELTRLRLASSFHLQIAPSLTDERAAIIIIRGPRSKTAASP